MHLNQPIVGIARHRTGGYWLVASDGGIFAFGTRRSTARPAAMHLNQPIVGMAATPPAGGYWLVASDGGIFAFGDAPFYGSTGAIRLNQPIVGMAATGDRRGLLVRRVRRRRLQLRRRPLLRLDRRSRATSAGRRDQPRALITTRAAAVCWTLRVEKGRSHARVRRTNSGIFKVLLVLHILSAIVGTRRRDAQRPVRRAGSEATGPAGRAVSEANYAVSSIAEKVIYLDPGVRHPARARERRRVEFSQHVRVAVARCCSSSRSASRTAC